jgi:hypothetical protein
MSLFMDLFIILKINQNFYLKVTMHLIQVKILLVVLVRQVAAAAQAQIAQQLMHQNRFIIKGKSNTMLKITFITNMGI